MAPDEAGTLCINADVKKFAGAYANATAAAEAYTNVYILMAEGFVCAQSRYDWVTNIASVNAVGVEFLRNVTAAYAAMMVIEHDMGGYTMQAEVQVMIDILWSMVVECINLLRDDKFRTFLLS